MPKADIRDVIRDAKRQGTSLEEFVGANIDLQELLVYLRVKHKMGLVGSGKVTQQDRLCFLVVNWLAGEGTLAKMVDELRRGSPNGKAGPLG